MSLLPDTVTLPELPKLKPLTVIYPTLPRWWWINPWRTVKLLHSALCALKEVEETQRLEISNLSLSRLHWFNRSQSWERKAKENNAAHEKYIADIEDLLKRKYNEKA